VRRIIDLIRDNDIPVIFSESTVSPKPAEQVARETGSGLWRRALRGFAVDAGRAGADLSRPAQGDIANHRRRTDGKAMNAPASAGSQTVAMHRPRRA
jgi:hypothetical protein